MSDSQQGETEVMQVIDTKQIKKGLHNIPSATSGGKYRATSGEVQRRNTGFSHKR